MKEDSGRPSEVPDGPTLAGPRLRTAHNRAAADGVSTAGRSEPRPLIGRGRPAPVPRLLRTPTEKGSGLTGDFFPHGPPLRGKDAAPGRDCPGQLMRKTHPKRRQA